MSVLSLVVRPDLQDRIIACNTSELIRTRRIREDGRRSRLERADKFFNGFMGYGYWF
jgi:hypothetical protein